MPKRSIVHMDLDSFFVSVELLRNSALRGKPVIIGGSSRRGVVSSCSYEARHFGVRSAMPMRMAKELCPDAIVISGDMESYSKYSSLVTDVIKESAPVYEKASIDEFYLDISGMDRFFGCYKWTGELKDRVMRETGLPISFGLSVNKTVSKMGTNESKPNGQVEIPFGTERGYIAPLSIQKIPGLGQQSFRLLSAMGVRTIKTLSEMPQRYLEREFGKSGISMWKKANGIDHSPVVPYSERKSISAERTFMKDSTDVKYLKSVITRLTEKIAHQLRDKGKLTSTITVKIRYSDFNTVSRQSRVAYTASDHILIKTAHELFDALYERRVLIRLVGVRFSGLVQGNYQIRLFEDSEELVRLYQAMDRMKRRFGNGAVMRAVGIREVKEKND